MNKNTFLCVIITCLIFANFFIYSKVISDTIPEAVYPNYVSDKADAENIEEDSNKEPEVTYLTASTADTKSGDLVLINTTHPYAFDNSPSVVRYLSNVSVYTAKTPNYSVSNMNVFMDETAIDALNRMMDDFYAHLGNKKTIIVTQGLRTYEEQQEMLELKISQLGENQTIAQKPGYSEHHTGLAMDISTYVNGVMGTFTGENEYAWVHENAHKYGFILRYPSGKEDITGISHETWHFRYVGVPHAQYMYRNGYTLEEYIDILAMYPFESIQLNITDEVTGKEYSIYSVPVEQDGTRIPVPARGYNGYTLSGDNNEHIIVTVEKESAMPSVDTTTPTEDIPTEDTSVTE